MTDSSDVTTRRGRRPEGAPAAAAAGFTLALGLYEALFVGVPYAAFLDPAASASLFTFGLKAAVLVAVYGAVALLAWATFTAPAWLRVVSFAAVAAALAVQYGYWHALGRWAEPVDLYVAATATGDNLWGAARLYASPLVVPPLLLYGGLLWWTRRTRRSPLRVAAALALVAVLSLAAYGVVRDGVYAKVSLYAFVRTLTVWPIEQEQPWMEWSWLFTHRAERDAVAHRATAPPTNNVVLVVDESVRADRLGINGYGRPTAPYLDTLAARGLVRNWGVASAAATLSYNANAVLLTGVRALPDTTYRTRRWPTVFDYAKAMGYTTHYLSGQVGEANARPEEMSAADMDAVDHVVSLRDVPRGPGTDDALAARAAAILRAGTGRFVVLQKRGLHFPYDDTYPPDAARWRPVLGDRYDAALREEIGNSYDNGLRYNLDRFFRTLVPDADALARTTILYTSDHGQTLSEGGENYTHGGASRAEAAVPMLLLTSAPLAPDTTYPARHANVVPTLLDLLGVPAAARPYDYAPSLLVARRTDAAPRYFLHGTLHGNRLFAERGGTRSRGVTRLVPFDE